MSIGILPNVSFIKTESGCKFGAECSFPYWKFEEQSNKKPKKGDDKSAVAIVKSVRQSGCVSQDAEPSESVSISRKGTKVLESIRRVRFTSAALRQANIQEKEGPSLGKIQVKIPHQRSPYAVKFEDRSPEEIARLQHKNDVPAEMRGNLPGKSLRSKRKTKLRSVRLLESGSCRPHPQ